MDRCDAPTPKGLEARILGSLTAGADPEEIRKDLHLVSAALHKAAPIASSDSTFRKRLVAALENCPELPALEWVDPANLAESPVAWLQAGAPLEKERTLGHGRA